MAHPSFRVGSFKVWGRYEIHFGKEGRRLFFYEMEDMENRALVDSKDGLTEAEFLGAVGCALDPLELLEFQRLVESL